MPHASSNPKHLLPFPDRFHNLDFFRGIAALGVIAWHWQFSIGEGKPPGDGFNRSTQPLYGFFGFFYEFGGHGVSFFFVLSGFIFFWLYRESISKGEVSFGRFLLNRLARLYPLHFLTLISVAILQQIHFAQSGNYFQSTYNDAYHFLLQIFFLSNWGFEKGFSFNVPIWSVSIECGLYLLFFAACHFKKLSLYQVLAIIGIACVAEIVEFLPHWMVPIEAFFMGGTVAILLPWLSKWTFIQNTLIALTFAIWICILCSHTIATLFLTRFHIGILLTFPLTICTLVLIEQKRYKIPKYFTVLGDISFGIYLIHFPMQIALQILVTYFQIPVSAFYRPTTLITFVASVIALALLSFNFYEKPLQTIIRKRLSSPKKESVTSSTV